MIERKSVSTTGELRDAYNRLYDTTPLGETPRFYHWILSLITPKSSSILLDIACGTGGLIRVVQGKIEKAIGVDLSDRALLLAKEKNRTGAICLACGENLPFLDNSFDIITHLGNLEHFLDPLRGILEIHRLLKPDGVAVVMLPNSFYSGDLWKVIKTGYGPNHHQAIDRFATVREWEDLLTAGGLLIKKTVPYNKFKWVKRLLPKNLAYHFVFLCEKQV